MKRMIGRGLVNNSQPGGNKRKLYYIPIIHTLADMGTLGPSVRAKTLSALGRQGYLQHTAGVERMWTEIERVTAKLPVTPGTVRVYQDGLPVCGREREIVSELAAAGNRNHKLLLKLEERGATLMGTELPELLIEEYKLASAEFPSEASAGKNIREKQSCDSLLLVEKRDRYIADRINRTLHSGESGILFMGMLHDVPRYLDSDIQVLYPHGRQRVRGKDVRAECKAGS